MLGAQFDGQLVNNTKSELLDWVVKIEVPEGTYIDSDWNGTFTIENNILTIESSKKLENQFIDPASLRTFGCVMYTDRFVSPKIKEIQFKKIYVIHRSNLFWFLIAISLIAIGQLISFLCFTIRLRLVKSRELIYETLTEQALKSFANTIELKDKYTKGHSSRVSEYAKKLAQELNLPEQQIRIIYYSAILHDVGKILIPDEILTKKEKLTKDEKQIMKNHSLLSYNILKDFSAVKNIASIVRSHHENFDGSGYPDNLSGEQIPFETRILTIADHFDAMTSDRGYNIVYTKEEAVEELKRFSGIKYDPILVPVFITLIEKGELDYIYRSR